MKKSDAQERTNRMHALLGTFVRGRWLLVAAGVLLWVLVLAPWRGTPYMVSYLAWGAALVACYALTNIGAHLALSAVGDLPSARRTLSLLAAVLIGIDLTFFSIAVWATGGVASPVFVLYFVNITIAALLLGVSGTLLAGGVAMALYTLLVYFEYKSWIPHQSGAALFNGIFRERAPTINMAAVVDSSFVILTLLGAITNRELRLQDVRIREQQVRLGTIVRTLHDGLIFLDAQMRVVFLNPRAEELLRTDKRNIIGTPLHLERYVKDTHGKEAVREVMTRPYHPKRIVFSGVVESTIEVTHTVIGKEGAETGHLIVLHDVTREELMNHMKTEFISIAAHQLRTPISGIKWTMESVLSGDMGPLTQDQKTYLSRADEANERMIRLVNDLLNVARIEEGRFGYEMKLTSFEKFLEEIVHTTRLKADARHIDLALQLSAQPLPPFLFDPERLRLAYENIIDNAISYTPAGGKVTVRVNTDGYHVRVTITDTGIGIPPHQLPRLFTKFFRADNALKVKTDGTGLGLYLARNIIEAHHGTIHVESKLGEGTVFTTVLPMKRTA